MGIGKKSHASENIFKRSDFLTPKVRRKVSAQNYFALYSQIFLSACFSFPKDVERKVSAQLSLTSESSKKSERSDFHFFCRTQLLKIILSACFSLSLWPPNNLERSTLFDLRASQEKWALTFPSPSNHEINLSAQLSSPHTWAGKVSAQIYCPSCSQIYLSAHFSGPPIPWDKYERSTFPTQSQRGKVSAQVSSTMPGE